MQTQTVQDQLSAKVREIHLSVPVQWKVPPVAPADPLNAPFDPAWPNWSWGCFQKHTKNWFYAEVTMPETHGGIRLDASPVMVFIHGWLAFTLWIDGQECYKEEHTWKGTGPIADPLPVPFKAGKPYRLVACIEPTDSPGDQYFTMEFRSRGTMEHILKGTEPQ